MASAFSAGAFAADLLRLLAGVALGFLAGGASLSPSDELAPASAFATGFSSSLAEDRSRSAFAAGFSAAAEGFFASVAAGFLTSAADGSFTTADGSFTTADGSLPSVTGGSLSLEADAAPLASAEGLLLDTASLICAAGFGLASVVVSLAG